MVVVVVAIVVVVVEVVGGLVEVVAAGGRVLVEDVLSGSTGGAGWPVEQPATPSRSAIHAPAIAMVRGTAPVLIPVGRVVVGRDRALGRRSRSAPGPVTAQAASGRSTDPAGPIC